jgi:hypothetical protein
MVGIVTALGMVPALGFVALRIEVLFGGRGDRFIAATPVWLVALGGAVTVLAVLVVDRSIAGVRAHSSDRLGLVVVANGVVVVLYACIAFVIVRTQARHRAARGGWSVAGLALGAIFASCALMHAAYAGTARGDAHIVGIDLWGIPAALYFLWVVRGIARESRPDWNRRPVAGSTLPVLRRSPWAGPRG